jgi:hypothetical protein
VTLSGRFCRKRILFGGRYSSGICTAGRFGAGSAAPPSTERGEKINNAISVDWLLTLSRRTFRLKLLLQGVRVARLL